MQTLFIIIICIIAISIVVIVMIRARLKDKDKRLSNTICALSSYSTLINYEQSLSEDLFIDIPTDINSSFYNTIISSTQKSDYIYYYQPLYQEADTLLKKLAAFRLSPSDTISKFIDDFEAIDTLVKQHNEDVFKFLLDKHKVFFDHCLNYPLDKQQRRAIVSEEDNCLVVSSAGSGKTSSIIGKVKYLTEVKGIEPHRILLISYTNKAAAELTERLATEGLQGFTFHKLALDIIGKATGSKPSICDNTDSLFISIYHSLLENKTFKNSVLEYFVDYQVDEANWEQRKNERRDKLTEQKNAQLKSIFPDIDGRTIHVKSAQEQKICFVLTSLGVKFRYE